MEGWAHLLCVKTLRRTDAFFAMWAVLALRTARTDMPCILHEEVRRHDSRHRKDGIDSVYEVLLLIRDCATVFDRESKLSLQGWKNKPKTVTTLFASGSLLN